MDFEWIMEGSCLKSVKTIPRIQQDSLNTEL